MLIEFSVANFRSFYEKRTFTMVATGISDLPENVASVKRRKVLRTAAIYGANASGKSNLIHAMARMSYVIAESVKLNDDDTLSHDPFLLKTGSEMLPTYFESVFIMDNDTYKYGFEYDNNRIVAEWLFRRDGRRDVALFLRNEEGIGVSENLFAEGMGLEEKTNENRLFLSVVAQLGGDISKRVVSWFGSDFNAVSGSYSNAYQGYSKKMFHEKLKGHEAARKFLEQIKLGLGNLVTVEKEFDPSELPGDLSDDIKDRLVKQMSGKKELKLFSTHKLYNDKGVVVDDNVPFDVYDKESEGTQKLLDMAGPIFDSLAWGKTLIIDELDCRMHPYISWDIVRLFNNKMTNPNNAQLIFTTHDTSLLSSKLFRRDQIWFTEKDELEQTDIYIMNDIVLPNGQKPRNDSNYEKNYIAGRYGAIPYNKVIF